MYKFPFFFYYSRILRSGVPVNKREDHENNLLTESVAM